MAWDVQGVRFRAQAFKLNLLSKKRVRAHKLTKSNAREKDIVYPISQGIMEQHPLRTDPCGAPPCDVCRGCRSVVSTSRGESGPGGAWGPVHERCPVPRSHIYKSMCTARVAIYARAPRPPLSYLRPCRTVPADQSGYGCIERPQFSQRRGGHEFNIRTVVMDH